jgi:hypothetical protein
MLSAVMVAAAAAGAGAASISAAPFEMPELTSQGRSLMEIKADSIAVATGIDKHLIYTPKVATVDGERAGFGCAPLPRSTCAKSTDVAAYITSSEA